MKNDDYYDGRNSTGWVRGDSRREKKNLIKIMFSLRVRTMAAVNEHVDVYARKRNKQINIINFFSSSPR